MGARTTVHAASSARKIGQLGLARARRPHSADTALSLAVSALRARAVPRVSRVSPVHRKGTCPTLRRLNAVAIVQSRRAHAGPEQRRPLADECKWPAQGTSTPHSRCISQTRVCTACSRRTPRRLQINGGLQDFEASRVRSRPPKPLRCRVSPVLSSKKAETHQNHSPYGWSCVLRAACFGLALAGWPRGPLCPLTPKCPSWDSMPAPRGPESATLSTRPRCFIWRDRAAGRQPYTTGNAEKRHECTIR